MLTLLVDARQPSCVYSRSMRKTGAVLMILLLVVGSYAVGLTACRSFMRAEQGCAGMMEREPPSRSEDCRKMCDTDVEDGAAILTKSEFKTSLAELGFACIPSFVHVPEPALELSFSIPKLPTRPVQAPVYLLNASFLI